MIIDHLAQSCRRGLGLCALLTAAATLSLPAAAADQVEFGAPPWPGVTAKTEVASQIVEAMGYDTKTTSSSPSFLISGLKSADLDVYLGGWIPTEEKMIRSAEDEGKVKVLGKNIEDAIMGLAVPKYVWDAGIHSEADLAEHADQFDHELYGIESGSGFNELLQQAIDDDYQGLGDWQLVSSSTSAMLAQVQRKIKHDDWVVFLGWEPHWMNISIDFKYLEPEEGSEVSGTKSDVLTVVNPDFAEDNPELTRFFKQFRVDNEEQSEWIYEFSKKERDKSEVASEWIGQHMDRVEEWLDGVEDKDGDPAIDAVKEKFDS